MTAEVVVMNKQALAIAADSAVTIGRGSSARVFNSAEKLFALSKTHPVGIMFFSSTQIMGVPIETVVKAYRKQRGSKSLDTIEDYFDDFRDYIASNNTLFSQSEREENCARQVAMYLEDMHVKVMTRAISSVPPMKAPPQRQLTVIARAIVKERSIAIMKSTSIPGITAKHQQKINRITRPVVEFWLKNFSNDFHLGRDHLKLLRELSYHLLTHQYPGVSYTGVVIAGFGEKEKYPSVCSGQFEYSFEGVSKFQESVKRVENDNDGIVFAFAQRDMVSLFMEGKSVVYKRLSERILRSVLRKTVLKNLKGSRMNQLKKNRIASDIAKQVKVELARALDSSMQEYYIEPIVRTVSGMPKVDLAATAEALVNLTVVKHRASPGHDTVGPPIDVAVISKGDGFIWVKRKHYFDAALNPRFVYNDRREVLGSG